MDHKAVTPWMHPVELSQLLGVMKKLAPERCLEWGCGGSTEALLSSPSVKSLVSIEHDEGWYTKVLKEVKDPRLDLRLVRADKPAARMGPGSAWAALAESDSTLLHSYVDAPEGVFDFVFVDGRARRFCLLRGHSLLREGGIMMLHDAQRIEYQDVLQRLKAKPQEPWHQGQMSVMTKSSP